MVAESSFARASPFISRASAAITPGPPALVSTAMRGPAGRGQASSASAQSNIVSALAARRIPALSKAASNAASDPASAPVCEAAACLTGLEASDLQGDDRLPGGGLPGCLDEAAAIGYALQIQGDHLRVIIRDKHRQEVGLS